MISLKNKNTNFLALNINLFLFFHPQFRDRVTKSIKINSQDFFSKLVINN